MKTRVTERLRREASAFALRFACEDCSHVADEEGELRCSLGYPPAPRREALGQAEIVFCKEFDLGGRRLSAD
ncbi:MAG TPA: hypothetical protein VN894_00835, partial [Polyangiaceae bacterium]|nr:hypothetical protein [Polyangiaceae bacterium]